MVIPFAESNSVWGSSVDGVGGLGLSISLNDAALSVCVHVRLRSLNRNKFKENKPYIT